jgi:hypothetical protein
MSEVQLTFVRETLQYKLLKDEFDADINTVSDTIYNAFEGLDMYNGYTQHITHYDNIYDAYSNDINDMYKRLNRM